MRAKEVENNQSRKLRFKIVEKGGVTLEQKLRRSNPWANNKCERQIMESVQISNFPGPVLMNRRNEMGGVRVERMQHRRWGGN